MLRQRRGLANRYKHFRNIEIMQCRKLILLVWTSLVLAGCATTGPIFSPYGGARAEQGVVYVYRPEARGLAILSAEIEMDGRLAAVLKNGEYAAIPIDAGPHTITHRWKAGLLGNSTLENRPITMLMNATQRKEYYVRLGMDSSWSSSGLKVHNQWQWDLREVTVSDAMNEIKACRLGEIR